MANPFRKFVNFHSFKLAVLTILILGLGVPSAWGRALWDVFLTKPSLQMYQARPQYQFQARTWDSVQVWSDSYFPQVIDSNRLFINNGVVSTEPVFVPIKYFTARTCPDGTEPEVNFWVDCSRFEDEDTLARCQTFINNVACRVYPAYKNITQISPKEYCPTITYTLYPVDQWPQDNAGGQTRGCNIIYQDIYSVNSDSKNSSDIGVYDVHELLHIFHKAAIRLPDNHYAYTAQTEATKLAGDLHGFQEALGQLTREYNNLVNNPERIQGNCKLAHLLIEEGLYLIDNENIYRLYSLIYSDPVLTDEASDFQERTLAYSEVLWETSGNNYFVRQYLTDLGCWD